LKYSKMATALDRAEAIVNSLAEQLNQYPVLSPAYTAISQQLNGARETLNILLRNQQQAQGN
jgi:uncharacterized protein involved in exopolysaccharide biosynthesis